MPIGYFAASAEGFQAMCNVLVLPLESQDYFVDIYFSFGLIYLRGWVVCRGYNISRMPGSYLGIARRELDTGE
ncbi:hypothetical protein OROMI_018826 [Orobanche minor]